MQGHLQLRSSIQLFDKAFAIKRFSFWGARFKRIFGMETRHFQKVVLSWYEIVPLLVIFHLPYSKCKDVKICFYPCRYQNQNFTLVSHSCRTRVVPVALMSHLCRSRSTRVSLVPYSCRTRVAHVLLVSYSCH